MLLCEKRTAESPSRKTHPTPGFSAAPVLILILGQQEKARKAGVSCRIREQFSAGQTSWRCTQSAAFANLVDLYITRAFSSLEWSNYILPTLNTAVFGFLIGVVSLYFGYTTNEGAQGSRKSCN
ncbi:MAG TPA: ABC transporter permease [Candidatus Angelobacter sp.]